MTFSEERNLFSIGLNGELNNLIFIIAPFIKLKCIRGFDILIIGDGDSCLDVPEEFQTHGLVIHCKPAMNYNLCLAANNETFCVIDIS